LDLIGGNMSLHTKADFSVFFIHIPRTGGRYIKKLFDKNDYQMFHDDWEQSIYGISHQHLHYPLYEWLEGVSEINHFTIVRDPFQKFCSATHCILNLLYQNDNTEDIVSELETKSGLENFIEYHSIVTRYNSNWFRPQKEFISPNAKIYRYENGLGKNFINWFNNTYSSDLIQKPFTYSGNEVELSPNILKTNKKIESLIRDYYKEDYEFFDY
jgi:hypothetical protein